MQKQIKLKGSSFWDKNKPLNKKRKVNAAIRSINSFSKKKSINRVSKTKTVIRNEIVRPYSNSARNTSGNRYLLDIIEKQNCSECASKSYVCWYWC